MIYNVLKGLVKLITANLGTKLMALLMALFTWFYINQEYTERTDLLEIPLKLEVPEGVISQTEDLSKGGPIGSVKVSLEGPRGILQDIKTNIICRHKVVAGNLNDQPIPQIEEIKPSDFNLPNSINVRIINPSKIKVWLMREMEKNLRLDAEKCSAGGPAKGYRIVEIKAEPSEILVRGPKYILQNRQSIPCAPVDISGATKSFSRAGKIAETIDNMPVSTNDSFRLMVTVDEGLVETTVKTNINILFPPDFAYQVKAKPQEIEVKLKGPAESLKALKKTDFNVFVNVANLYSNLKDVKPGSYPGVTVEFQLSEKAPRGIILAEPLNPAMIEITELPKTTPSPSPGQ